MARTVLCMALTLFPAVAVADGAPRPVTLQLNWSHQFQFAGYYAALEQGFYRDEGLAVRFAEHRPGITVEAEVASGRADFGVSSAQALIHYQQGAPIVVLAAVFQHAANVLLLRADPDLPQDTPDPTDLVGRRVMLPTAPPPSLSVMLARHGVRATDILVQQLTGNLDDLIHGETDAMSACLTSQPHALAQADVPLLTMRPADHGVDFYGDCLIASRRLARTDPQLVDSFLRASLRGWAYAMDHPEEIITLVRERYAPGMSREALRHEARIIEDLILPRLVDIGSMSRSRWERMAEECRTAGLLDRVCPLDDFFHTPAHQRSGWPDQGHPHLMGTGILVAAGFLLLALWVRSRHRRILAKSRQLERNRESLRQVIDLLPNMVYAKDREGRFLLANRAMADALGASVDELTGIPESEAHPDLEQARRRLAEDRMVFDSGHPVVTLEEPFRHRDGSLHWLQTTRLPYLPADTGEPAVLGLAVDITQRKLAEEALRKSEERFRAIFNQTFQFTAILSPDGTVIQVNDRSLEQLGRHREEMVGKPFWLAHWFEPGSGTLNWIKDAVLRAARGEVVRREAAAIRADGEPMVMDFSLKPVRGDDGTVILLIPEGRDITLLKRTEAQLRGLNEELERRVAERTRNLEQAKADLERSLDELNRTQEELILSEKLAALGGLVAGVAHEINTPLGIGVTASSFLADRVAELDAAFTAGSLKKSDLKRFLADARDSSASIQANLGRAAGLISSFKQVAADQSSELPRLFNLHNYVDEVLLSLGPRYRGSAHTVENLCQDVELYSYPGALVQIIANLLDNSLTHAFAPGEAGHIRIHGRAEDGNILFTFSDDGVGIPEPIRDKIFEPFVTTRRGSGGTGLGLHIVFNIVNKVLGGTIRLSTGPGKGTAFTVSIPREHVTETDKPEREA
ncbi:PAS domain S-box protein [Pseudodesulfovibrio sp. F-1]|uniref:histidine kinase n=1 Tax=Pseudodesulfovibrio alkaliphilus TaxID=2661613 RepID=A0A7K1KRF1_9BACT|nr:ABC transporter substrate-binding protein [Pseudodesulfovibrio alkaliphilus]MUM78657.1 PAS domain S-box protein [Pseudodesulfovibrio alkaliphilus]